MVIQQVDLITELQNFMFLTNKRFLVAQHGLGNLIVVEDEEEEEEEEEDNNKYFPLPGLAMVIHDVGVLQEIEDLELPPYQE